MSPAARRFFGCFLPLILAGLSCGTVVMATVAARAVAQYVPVEDDAMAPVLQEGWSALVFYTMVWAAEPRGGVIAQVESPDGRAFRRIAALPGDTVAIEGGEIVVNGEPAEPAELPTGTMADMAPLTLGEGEYFVLADDRRYPDSRTWGPIERSAIFGEPLFYREDGEVSPVDARSAPTRRRGRPGR